MNMLFFTNIFLFTNILMIILSKICHFLYYFICIFIFITYLYLLKRTCFVHIFLNIFLYSIDIILTKKQYCFSYILHSNTVFYLVYNLHIFQIHPMILFSPSSPNTSLYTSPPPARKPYCKPPRSLLRPQRRLPGLPGRIFRPEGHRTELWRSGESPLSVLLC